MSVPVVAFLPGPWGGLAALFLVILVTVLTVWDVVELGSVLLAWRRKERGLPPAREGVDYGVGPDDWLRTTPAEHPFRAHDRLDLAAFGSPSFAARVLARNLALRGLVVFGPLVALAAVNAAVYRSYGPHARGTARTALSSLRSATLLYRNIHPGGDCPGVSQLREERLIDPWFSAKDPWGGTWVLRCDGDDIVALSAGPDRRSGTADDIVVPREGAH